MAGVGSNSTASALELSLSAQDLGADILLHVLPYFNRPTVRGIKLHFRTIRNYVKLPMFMSYNPMRSNSEIDVKSIIKLATEGTIQGIIIESGELGFFTELLEHRPENFQVFTTDRLMYSLMRLGADGVVSSIANFDYQRIENILTALVTGNLSEAKMMQNELELIAATMLHAPPPTVLKTVMSMLDSRYEECFRPPLCALDKSLKPIIQGMLKHCKL